MNMRLLVLFLACMVVLVKLANGIDDTISNDGDNKIKNKVEPIILSSFRKIKEDSTTTTTIEPTIDTTAAPNHDQIIEQKREDELIEERETVGIEEKNAAESVHEEKVVILEEAAPSETGTAEPVLIEQEDEEIMEQITTGTDIPQTTEEVNKTEKLHLNRDVLDKQQPSPSSIRKEEGMVDRVVALIKDSTLNELNSNCIALNNASDGDNSLSSGIRCPEVEYAISLRNMYAEMTQERGLSLVKSIPKTPLTVKPRIGKDVKTEYASIFEDYIMKKRLFTDNMTADASSFHSVMEFCGTLGKGSPVLSEVSLMDCPKREDLFHKPEFKLPAVIYNNYFIRLKKQLSEGNSESSKIELLSRWPSIVSLQSDTPTNVMSCPSNLHQVLWGVGNRRVTIRLFHKAYAFAFMPRLNLGDLGDPLFVRNGFDESEDMDGGADSIERIVGKGQFNIQKQSLPKKYTEVVLQGNEYIFIPNVFLASIKLEGSDGVKAGHLFRSCFLDASNMNEFRDALRYSSKISSNDNIIYKAVTSADFYVSMERNPFEVDMQVYQMFPKPAISEMSPDTSNSKKRARRNSVNFRDWQTENKWNFMITGLTIPQPYVASVVEIKRKAIKLSWKSPYVPNANDKTKFGFNITICEGYDNFDENKGCNVHNFERDTPNLIEAKHESTVDVLEYYSVFTATITGLTHDTTYRFRTIIYYNLATSTPSEWSALIKTASLSEPGPLISISSRKFDIIGSNANGGVVLKFTGPDDDGGLPILGFHIYARHVQQYFPSHWIYIGPHYCNSLTQITQIEIKNSLFPDTIYEFKMSAFNSLGNGPISGISNKLHTWNISTDSTFYLSRPYFNDSHIPPSSISENWNEEHLQFYKYNTSKITTIDVSKQTVFSTEEQEVIYEGWRCHWSPKDFSVKGQSVWANPYDANTDLINNNIVDGRIVWILRGKSPVISKALRAQAAGAIGIVLVDGGKCTTFDQKCMPGADKSRGEYFAQYDKASYWIDLRIPVILVLLKDANSLAAKLNLKQHSIEMNNDELDRDEL